LQQLGKIVEISSIGGLSLSLNGSCMNVNGWKSPKVHQLLMAIVALGGRNVSVGDIGDLLWPDVDGDKAMQNLEFILRRLRQTLHKELGGCVKGIQLIQLNNKKISFNDEYCDLDIWRWQSLTGQARGLRQRGHVDAARDIECQVATMLTGAFLAGDHELMASYCMLWNNRFCNWIDEVLSRWRNDDAVTHAQIIALLDVGLGISPCSEKLCMQRMYVLLDEGYTVDAMRFFKEWAMLLKDTHGIQPSQKVHRVFTEIAGNNLSAREFLSHRPATAVRVN